MRIIQASFAIIEPLDGNNMIRNIERYARVCYKSEDKITDDSAQVFIRRILDSGHESVLEHEKITIKAICDRGVSHEIVRHRIASYSQESTRYCNYTKERFGSELTFIKPCFWDEKSDEFNLWKQAMLTSEKTYMDLISKGASPQEARTVLPNSLKTEIVITMNLREWRHFFRLRTSDRAHPQMREIASQILAELKRQVPIIFDDI